MIDGIFRWSVAFMEMVMSEIFSYICSSAPGSGLYEYTTIPFILSGRKYAARYCPINLPSLAPISSSLNSANKSIRPLLLGVPVRPTTLFTVGRAFISALNRLAWWFLKEDSSSITTISKLNGTPLFSISHCTFSRLMI